MVVLKVRKVGNSLGVVLPKEVVSNPTGATPAGVAKKLGKLLR